MKTLDKAMADVLNEVDGSIGAAVVDLRTSELMGLAQNTRYLTREYFEAVARAAVEMFRGKATTHVEDLITSIRGVPTRHFFQEVQMTSEYTIHFMMILPNYPEYLVTLITSRETALGLGWAAIRASVLEVEPCLDDMDT
ncbi:MAG: hypothetical protein FWG11_07865, partial [Promicromonosporaceae bacterium]|nr:hypothetical protein [Promicromonosporaceae bacterium]